MVGSSRRRYPIILIFGLISSTIHYPLQADIFSCPLTFPDILLKEGEMNTFWKVLVALIAIALLATAVVASVSYVFALDARERITDLEERVAGPRTGNNVVEVTCVHRFANGPPEVPFTHPTVILNHAGFPFEHWFEVVVEKEGRRLVQLVSSSGPYEGYDVLDGWIGDIRGGLPHIFGSSAGYTLRVWRHGYDEGMPEFEEEELVFEGTFEVPTCP